MLTILYQDDTLVVIDKPPGLLVHRSNLDRHETQFAVQMLRDQLGRHVWPAHRLDRGTSGALLFALDPETAGTLSRQFEAGTVDKDYLAVVRGHPPESGLIDHPLTRNQDSRDPAPATIQAAQTRYRQLGTVELPVAVDRYPVSRYALLLLSPITGRQHQIRRHLKHIAHPIIGDATYGKGRHNRFFAEHLGCARLMLACTRLAFDHPKDGRRIEVNAPVSGAFASLMHTFGWTSPGQ